MDYKQLCEIAIEAKKKAYAPYSNFHVGAAILTEDNTVMVGANIENSSYGLTVCAERTAVFNSYISGDRKFNAIAIASDMKDFTPPCGACRQVLLELCGKDLDVLMVNSKGNYKPVKLGELLPHSFDKSTLKDI